MRLVVIGAALLVFAAGSLLFAVWKGQRKLIYFPTLAPAPPPAASVLPGATDVTFETEDGLALRGWFVPALGETSRGAVVVFNGNAGSRFDRALIANAFRRTGLAVLLFDYRGYGGNPGEPSETGLILDGLAASRYLASRPEVDPERLVFYGESLGAAVAVAVAAAVSGEPAALILRSPFTTLADVGRVHYPFLPVRLLLRDRWPSLERLRSLSGPLLVIAGDRDEVVPFAQSETLYQTAPQSIKRFFEVPGAQHNSIELIGDDVMQHTVDFLERHTTVLRRGK